MDPDNEKEVIVNKVDMNDQLILKTHYTPVILNCAAEFSAPNYLGYLILLGGEALNHYLTDKIVTYDFDFKFVVTSKKIYESNIKRMHIANKMVKCLNQALIPQTSGNIPGTTINAYQDLRFVLTIKQKDEYVPLHVDGNRTYLIDKKTGKPSNKIFPYKYNKNFAIRLYYKKVGSKKEKEFSIIDVGLKYDIPEDETVFNFFARNMYKTFKKDIFKRINPHRDPIPYIMVNKIRYPKLIFLLYELFTLYLIYSGGLQMAILMNDEDNKKLSEEKIVKYKQRLDAIYKIYKKRNSHKIYVIERNINITRKKYAEIFPFIIKCFTKNNAFLERIKDIEECKIEPDLVKLEEFKKQYDKTIKLLGGL